MLLRKLSSNLNLEGISHVIVDEVHERNIQIDFLLILLRKLIENNKHIKIILMSATFNTCTFSQYFNNCPTVRVPGNVFPVKDYFLEDLQNFIPGINNLNRNDSVLDSDLVVKVINHINATQEPGAILCFLPGWNDIRTVHGKLLESNPNSSKLMICPAHSRLPHSEQRIIFEKPPEGVRKVILSTNIAETSITVDDVVYVVDSGLHKSTSFDGEKGIASLATEWITKANVRQRRGRAGRVKSGICYHLYKLGEFHNMAEYPIPELLRVPLENVILKCKLYCSNEKAEDVLSCALQPPTTSAIQNGVNELQELGILNEEENLTDLGKIVVNFGTHPRLSVALIYAAFLGCLNPVLNISAALTFGREPFINTLKDPGVIKEMKQAHDNLLYSDHLALSKIIDTWIELKEKSDASDYAANNLLDENNLTFIRDLKGLFSEDLYSAGILDKQEAYSDPLHKCNANSSHIRSILAALSAAFFPNVMKVSQGEVTHGKLKKDALTYSLLKGQRGYIQKESVVSNEYEFPSPWLIYFSALKSDARRLMMTSTVSSVPGLCLLLFNRQKLIYSMVI
ncbi:putative ATP-dependent RNA helicase DHX30, partial [Stegodyphus mimosarum]